MILVKKLNEFVLRADSMEHEAIFNSSAEVNKHHSDLLQQYADVEYLFHNLHNTTFTKEEKDKVRNQYVKIKKELHNLKIMDLNKDNVITTLKKYIKQDRTGTKHTLYYFEKLGLVKMGKVTDLGKWFANCLHKYSTNFRMFAVKDDELELAKDTLINLYANGQELKSYTNFKKELENNRMMYKNRGMC